MVEFVYTDLTSQLLRIVLTSVYVLTSLSFAYKGKRTDIKDEKIFFLYGLSILLLFQAISNTIDYYRILFLLGHYDGHNYVIESEVLSSDIVSYFKDLTYNIGFIFVFLSIDRTFIRTRYMLTSSSIVLLLFNIINQQLTIIVMMIFGTTLLAIFLWFSFKARIEYRAISTILLMGFLMNALGINLTHPEAVILNIIPPSIPYIFMILGALIFIIPLFIELKSFNRQQSLIFWSLLLLFNLVVFLFFLYLFLTYESLFYLIATLSGTILVILIIVIQIRKGFKIELYTERNNLLAMFSRPKKITEEEVAVSKEKQICIVCKNQIVRNTYVCPDCKSFYCFICKNALITTENACWVCETPFDETKPVKFAVKEEEKVTIESEDGKKS